MIVIDLFSGSGSATGIWENKGHEVYRYDIATHSKVDTVPTDLSDLVQVDILINEHRGFPIGLIWASPPCIEYSNANRLRNQKTGLIDGNLPNLDLWKNALYIIQELKPEYYIIENVVGAQKIWGPSRQNFGAYHFWGNFPKFNVPEKIPKKNLEEFNSKKERAKEGAKIPYCISWGLYRAITLQETLQPLH